MIQLLLNNPLLLLFVVAAIGYPLGRIKIAGGSLGIAAVLFVGLAIGTLHPDMKLPEIVYLLELVLFVYTIGLSIVIGIFNSRYPIHNIVNPAAHVMIIPARKSARPPLCINVETNA